MKTMRMTKEFIYYPKQNISIKYLNGATYDRVPEFASRAIIAADAGYIVEQKVEGVSERSIT